MTRVQKANQDLRNAECFRNFESLGADVSLPPEVSLMIDDLHWHSVGSYLSPR